MVDKIITIGGGISGMSFAYWCGKSDYKTKVFEKHNKLGGCIDSSEVNFMIFELGAHTLTNKYHFTIDILRNSNQFYKIQPAEN